MANSNAECPQCKKMFEKTRKHQKFCSPECRWLHWSENNPRVSKELLAKLKQEKSK